MGIQTEEIEWRDFYIGPAQGLYTPSRFENFAGIEVPQFLFQRGYDPFFKQRVIDQDARPSTLWGFRDARLIIDYTLFIHSRICGVGVAYLRNKNEIAQHVLRFMFERAIGERSYREPSNEG